ncbi:MAG: HIT family protein [Campylobacterota bacterium]|nr:HIT family protein [Campylobacterota bacterium]
MIILKNRYIDVQIEPSEIPWLKIFTIQPYKELSMCDKQTKLHIFETLDIVEKTMLDYFQPEKINIASFGNYMPHVHFHIMARFKEDSFYPEPMWGKKQRNAKLKLKDFDTFYAILQKELKHLS